MIRTRVIRSRLHQKPEALPLAQNTHLRRCAACDLRFTGRRDDLICPECVEDGVSAADMRDARKVAGSGGSS